MNKQRTASECSNMLRTAALLGMLSLASPAAAQVSPPAQPEQETGRTGGWVFTPAIGLGGSWDDNVLLLNPGNQPISDYASPISPSMTLDYTGRRLHFSSGYDGSLILYRSLDELTSFQQSLRAVLQHRATKRITIFAQENLLVAPTTDALMLNTGVPFYRVGSRINAMSGGFSATLQRHLSMRGAYTLRHVQFEFDEILGRDLHGGHAHEFDLSVDRALSPRLTLGGEYEFDRVTVDAGGAPDGFTSPTDLSDGPEGVAVTGGLPGDDRFNIQAASATLRYTVAPTLTLTGAVGVAQLGAGLTHDARTGPTYRVGLQHQTPRATLNAGYRRSYVPSFGFGGSFQNEEWLANVSIPFARNRAYAGGGVTWFLNESFQQDRPDLRSLWFTSTVGYRVTPWLRIEGFYYRVQQDTDQPGGRLGRNQAGFQIVTAKPLRLQ